MINDHKTAKEQNKEITNPAPSKNMQSMSKYRLTDVGATSMCSIHFCFMEKKFEHFGMLIQKQYSEQ